MGFVVLAMGEILRFGQVDLIKVLNGRLWMPCFIGFCEQQEYLGLMRPDGWFPGALPEQEV